MRQRMGISGFFGSGRWLFAGIALSPLGSLAAAPAPATATATATATASVADDWQGVRVLFQDHRGVTLEYRPGPILLEPTADPARGLLPRCEEASAETRVGVPAIPHRGVLLAVPDGADPKVRLEMVQARDWPESVSLVAVPEIDARGAWVFGTGAEDVPVPLPWVEGDAVAVQRGVSVIRVTLRPIQWTRDSRGDGRMVVADRLVVRVDFGGARPNVVPATGAPVAWGGDRTWSAIRSTAVANWASAAQWDRSRPLRLSGLGEPFPMDESDRWLRVTIGEEGLYAIGVDELRDAGVDPRQVDPASLRVFGRPPSPLEADRAETPVEFTEIAPRVKHDGDALFESGERLFFYGAPVGHWAEDSDLGRVWELHPYASENVYWVTWGWDLEGDPSRPVDRDVAPGGGEVEVDHGWRRVHREEENLSPRGMGTRWYWETQVGVGATVHRYAMDLPGARGSAPATVSVKEVGRTSSLHISGEHHVVVALGSETNVAAEASWDGEVAALITGEPALGPVDGSNDVLVTVLRDRDTGDYSDQLYLDWIQVGYTCNLVPLGAGDLDFEVERTEGEPAVAMTLSGFGGAPLAVLDVSDPVGPVWLAGEETADGVRIREDRAGYHRYFVAGEARSPIATDRHYPAGLRSAARGADWIAVTSAELAGEAERLAGHRAGQSALRTTVVLIEDVYAEFSAGVPDPTALRNFLRAAYAGWSGEAPTYVLLFGDGSFDMKNNSGFAAERNVLPTYQSPAPTHNSPIDAYDDWFVQVDGADNIQDMIVSRLTPHDVDDAGVFVDKIVGYETGDHRGDWRMRVTLVADDEVNPDFNYSGEDVHTRDSERLEAEAIPPWLEVEKVYLVDHLHVGRTKPSATEAIMRAFERGSLAINYLGHGNEVQWAHEDVFHSTRDIPMLSNGSRLPFVLSGSCTVGRFDLEAKESMAEDLTGVEDAGAIAMVAATRPTFSDPNFRMMRTLLQQALALNDRSELQTIGQSHLTARLQEGNYRNERLNHLFGDPALTLALPDDAVAIDPVVGPLVPLAPLTVRGRVVDAAGAVRRVDGKAQITVRDSGFGDIYTIPGSRFRMPVERRGRVVYRGSSSVVNGEFEAQMVVPRGFRGGEWGEISVYAEVGGEGDAGGVRVAVPYDASSIALDAAEALNPVDEAAGLHVAQLWGWSTSGIENRQAVVGAPDGVDATLSSGAWIGLDFDDDADPDVLVEAGIKDGAGADVEIVETAGASYVVYGSNRAVDWAYLGMGTGRDAFDLDGALSKARFLRVFPTSLDTVSEDSSPPEIRAFVNGVELGESARAVARGTDIAYVLDDVQGISLLPGASRGLNLRIEKVHSDGYVAAKSDIDVSADFRYDHGSARRGRLTFDFDQTPGSYELTLSASDNTGARGQLSSRLEVIDEALVSAIRSYPNPFSDRTYITWLGTQDSEPEVRIYTVTGRLIRTLRGDVRADLDGYGYVEWDGRDEDGDRVANGVYLCRVALTRPGLRRPSQGMGKLVVMR